MATGVMAIAVGQATRLLRFLDDDKSYEAKILFGRQTDTDDIEGTVTKECADLRMPERDKLEAALTKFRGPISQVPPLYSALHVDGKRLYELARNGEIAESQIKAREVIIHKIELTAYEPPYIGLFIHCGKGTYIRSIARDLGRLFETGACLAGLRRTTSGKFSIAQALTLSALEERLGDTGTPMLAIADVLPLPKIQVDEEQTRRLKMGQTVESKEPLQEPFVLVLNNDKVVCVAVPKSGQDSALNYLKPEVVLSTESN